VLKRNDSVQKERNF